MRTRRSQENGNELAWSRFKLSADMRFLLLDSEWTKVRPSPHARIGQAAADALLDLRSGATRRSPTSTFTRSTRPRPRSRRARSLSSRPRRRRAPRSPPSRRRRTTSPTSTGTTCLSCPPARGRTGARATPRRCATARSGSPRTAARRSSMARRTGSTRRRCVEPVPRVVLALPPPSTSLPPPRPRSLLSLPPSALALSSLLCTVS